MYPLCAADANRDNMQLEHFFFFFSLVESDTNRIPNRKSLNLLFAILQSLKSTHTVDIVFLSNVRPHEWRSTKNKTKTKNPHTDHTHPRVTITQDDNLTL
jgi:hypothetical protein